MQDVDFRAAAVAESLVLLADRGVDDPLAAGVSCCLPGSPDGQLVLRKIKKMDIVGATLGTGAWLAGGLVLAWLHVSHKPGTEWLEFAILVGSVTLGFIILFRGTTAVRRLIRTKVNDRLGTAWRDATAGTAVAAIEEPRTFHKLKAMPEDAGLLLLHAERQCVEIEGLTHRYFIYGPDVISLHPIRGARKNSFGTALSYRVGNQVLSIVVKVIAIQNDVRTGLGLNGNSALALLVKTLNWHPQALPPVLPPSDDSEHVGTKP